MDNFTNIISQLFWIFIIFMLIYPSLQMKMLISSRYRMISLLEKKRNSRVITLIHRQETINILGIPLVKYIDISDSEEILRAIRLTPEDMPIDLILHTPGGLVLAAEQIASAIVRHKAPVTVFVPHYAMSGGTLLTLAADKVIMDENAVLGPVDPQIDKYPAISILEAVSLKNKNDLDDETLILADIAKKAINQLYTYLKELLIKNGVLDNNAEKIAKTLTEGKWTHDYPISAEEAKQIGLNISTDMPQEVYDLMELYPQAGVGRPSVQYIPIPYHKKEK